MMWVGIAMAVAAVAATMMGGLAAKGQADAQSDIADYQSIVAEQNADATRKQAGIEEDEARRAKRRALGLQRAAEAESGVEFSGSALDLLEQSSRDAEFDALSIRYIRELEARGYDNAATLADYEAKAYTKQGQVALYSAGVESVGNGTRAYFAGAGGGGGG